KQKRRHSCRKDQPAPVASCRHSYASERKRRSIRFNSSLDIPLLIQVLKSTRDLIRVPLIELHASFGFLADTLVDGITGVGGDPPSGAWHSSVPKSQRLDRSNAGNRPKSAALGWTMSATRDRTLSTFRHRPPE